MTEQSSDSEGQPQVEKEIVYVTKETPGLMTGIIASVLAILGIFTLGFVFIPIATFIALIGSFIAVKHKNSTGIAMNALAWILIIVGFMTSPFLLGIINVMTSPEGTYSTTTYSTTYSGSSSQTTSSPDTQEYSGVIPIFPKDKAHK